MDFGGGAIAPTPPSFSDIFLLGLDAGGGFRFVKQYGSTKIETAHAVAVDPAGDLLLCGEFDLAIDFGGGALTSPTYPRAFVTSLTDTGAYRWATGLNTTTGSGCRSLGVHGGAIVLSGVYWGTVDFGQGPLPAAGGLANAFLLKLAP